MKRRATFISSVLALWFGAFSAQACGPAPALALFDYGSADVRAASIVHLSRFTDLWKGEDPRCSIIHIVAHMDSGEAAAGLAVDALRAETVQTVLLNLGLMGREFRKSVRGATQPLKPKRAGVSEPANRYVMVYRQLAPGTTVKCRPLKPNEPALACGSPCEAFLSDGTKCGY